MSKHFRVGTPAKRIWDHFYGRHPRMISPEMKVDAHTVTKYLTIYAWRRHICIKFSFVLPFRCCAATAFWIVILPLWSGKSFLPALRLSVTWNLFSLSVDPDFPDPQNKPFFICPFLVVLWCHDEPFGLGVWYIYIMMLVLVTNYYVIDFIWVIVSLYT